VSESETEDSAAMCGAKAAGFAPGASALKRSVFVRSPPRRDSLDLVVLETLDIVAAAWEQHHNFTTTAGVTGTTRHIDRLLGHFGILP
jgi:hypothetical protein